MSKTGLVLCGGGAKGAYQAGVLRAMAELNIEVDCVAGTSIGAMNGAIVASSEDTRMAGEKLTKLWSDISKESPIQLDHSAVAGLFGWYLLTSLPLARGVSALLPWILRLGGSSAFVDQGVCNDNPINDFLQQHLDTDDLKKGLPLYVALYEKRHGPVIEALEVLAAELGIADSRSSDYLHVQSFDENQMATLLKASAALPIIFSAQKVGDREFRDGGMGGWQGAEGNTPAEPLLVKEAVDYLIVSHLDRGSHWQSQSRNLDAAVIEIRPSKDLGSLLDFSSSHIESLMEQGYQDALSILRRHQAAVNRVSEHNSVRKHRDLSCSKLLSDDFYIE